jgi:hypothetical protein
MIGHYRKPCAVPPATIILIAFRRKLHYAKNAELHIIWPKGQRLVIVGETCSGLAYASRDGFRELIEICKLCILDRISKLAREMPVCPKARVTAALLPARVERARPQRTGQTVLSTPETRTETGDDRYGFGVEREIGTCDRRFPGNW